MCGSNANNANQQTQAPQSSALKEPVPDPFTRLKEGNYLHGRPEQDVFKLLIDCYRMRQEDDYKLEGDVDADGLYGGARDSSKPFSRFLDLASSRPNLLPAWWNDSKRAECEAFAKSDDWYHLGAGVEKQDIIDHYSDTHMPMALRMLGTVVYKRGPGGQDGTGMLDMMVMMEGGNITPS